MIEIIPTVVPKNYDDVVASVDRWHGIAPMLHVDVGDGFFSKHETWMPTSEKTLPLSERIAYEAHLMTEDPRAMGEKFIRAGAWRIIGHLETLGSIADAEHTLEAWRAMGAHEVGVALLLTSAIDALEPLLSRADVIHIMTIATIGTQNIPFSERGVDRVKSFKEKHPNVVISVDGGVSDMNIGALARAGASRFCVGSDLAHRADPVAEYHALHRIATEALEE